VWGFGSPDSVGAVTTIEHFDWGFGDLEPVGWSGVSSEDWGFGSAAPQLVIVLGSDATVPDWGGEVLRLVSSWDELGPYRVILKSVTGTTYPSPSSSPGLTGAAQFTPGGRPVARTDPTLVYTSVSSSGDPGRFVDVVLPPLVPGRYSVTISWGAGFLQSREIADALRVVWRSRGREAWMVRRSFPPRLYDLGPVVPRLEVVLSEGDHNSSGA